MLRIKSTHRDILSKPFGRVYEGKGVELVKRIEELKNSKLVVAIGDLVSLYTLKAGYKPKIIVIDFKTERRELGETFEKEITPFLRDYVVVKVKNPQGHISDELVETLFEAVKSEKRYCIIVEGEEDLAALPLSIILPENSLILYGVPGRGIAAYTVNERDKILISRIIEEMEEVGEDKVKKMLIGGEVYGASNRKTEG